jgi:hypoxanthine phosphoribosyltransferase
MLFAVQHDIASILIEKDRIAQRVHELGHRIAQDLYREGVTLDGISASRVVIIPVLTGSMVFVADLIRELPFKLRMEVVAVSSYPGKSVESKGVKLKGDLPSDLVHTHVILVDDIFDSGQTLDVLTHLIAAQKPASLRTCVLLRKPGKAKVKLTPDYVGFDIPDEFVVGYGLDYDGYYRNFPAVAVLKETR